MLFAMTNSQSFKPDSFSTLHKSLTKRNRIGTCALSTSRHAFKSGHISIIGNPNVGKSTLLNKILDKQLCASSHKPQTTRQRILGIKTTSDYQMVFSDTPGIITEPKYLLQKSMMSSIKSAVYNCNLLLLITDIYSDQLVDEHLFARSKGYKIHITIYFYDFVHDYRIRKSDAPIMVVVNKLDILESCRTQYIEREQQQSKYSKKLNGIFILHKHKLLINSCVLM